MPYEMKEETKAMIECLRAAHQKRIAYQRAAFEALIFFVMIVASFYVMGLQHARGEDIKPRVIKITATADGRFEPSVISVRAGEEILFEVHAYRDPDSRFSTWPPGILHGFMIRSYQIVLEQKALTNEITFIPWSTLIPGKLTLSCWFHKDMQATILVK